MDVPKLQVNDQSPVADSISPASEAEENSSVATRKSLHQNIIGKLRPLPLQYHWTVWFDKFSESADYDERLYVLFDDFADIGTFYRIYNNYPWERIRMRDSVHIFRMGVRPIWEDPENLKGGCWKFRVSKDKAKEFFHETTILCLANELQVAVEGEHDHVLGVSTSVRFNSNLISVWNKLGSNERSIQILGQTIINRLSPDLRPTDSKSYFYKRHDENEGYHDAVAGRVST